MCESSFLVKAGAVAPVKTMDPPQQLLENASKIMLAIKLKLLGVPITWA